MHNRVVVSVFSLTVYLRSVSTPFIYYPRSRPAVPLPAPMRQSFDTFKFIESDDWRCYEATMKARLSGGKDILCRVSFFSRSASTYSDDRIVLHPCFTSVQHLTAYPLPCLLQLFCILARVISPIRPDTVNPRAE